ncbi:MAG: putative iron-regulated protein [Gammaproteobacteria bacterium]|jgi:uncharacterized iron-regulated protein
MPSHFANARPLSTRGTLSALLLAAGASLVACSTTSRAPDQADSEYLEAFETEQLPWSAPSITSSVSIRDGHTGDVLSFDQMLERLAQADVVFLGETHLDETTHRFEDAVLAGLVAKRDGEVVLSMEMFERDTQGSLDDYLAGRIGEAEFLASSRPWSNYQTGYRPMIERAKREGLAVIAANFPAPLRRRFAMEGEEVLGTLSPEERAILPAEFLPNRPQYWRRVDNAVRGHLAMMGGPKDPGDPRIFAGQSLWDNAMGDACAQALIDHPGKQVVHVNGGFHTKYWDGTVHQLRMRAPDANVLTIDIVPTSNPTLAGIGGPAVADFVVFASAEASDISGGTYSLEVSRELRYRLHLPKSASAETPVPLLIWLGEAGSTPKEGLALWRARLGEDCAIAVVEAPYRAVQEDLVAAGSWFWPDTFAEDAAVLTQGIASLRGYITRNMPVDGNRVVVAGQGTGGTIAVVAGLHSGGLDVTSVAFTPRQYSHLSDTPMSLPEFAGEDGLPRRIIHVVAGATDNEWWQGELAVYAKAGIETTLVTTANDPWFVEANHTNTICSLLGLELPASETAQRSLYHMTGASPRAARWGLIRAAQTGDMALAILEEEPAPGTSTPLDAVILAADMEDSPPPSSPGAFGGTTILVLPAGLGEAEREAWFALEENDPLAAQSRFNRLRIATMDETRPLSEVLETLFSEGRKNVLILPAEFCASAATMRALRDQTRDTSDQMTLHWLPGLGGPR